MFLFCYWSFCQKKEGSVIMIEALRNVVGEAPAGLEFVEYIVCVGFTVAAVYFVYKLISTVFSIF